MAYYDALKTQWLLLTPGTTAAKLAQINAMTVPAGGQKAMVTPSQVLNACVFADLAGLTALQVAQLTLMLQGSEVDASAGSSIRLGIQTLFAGKATTLANLATLVAPFDSPTIPWWQANGYTSPFTPADLAAAGNLT